MKKLAVILGMFWRMSGAVYAENKTVKFTFFNDFEPFSISTSADVSGHFIDVITQVFENIEGYEPVFYGDAWKRAQVMVKNELTDGHFTVAVDHREEYMFFTEDVGIYNPTALFYAKDNPKASAIQATSSKQDLKQFKLVDYRGNGCVIPPKSH